MTARGYLRPMPEGFADVAWTIGLKALEERFKVGQVVVMRWRRELGPDPRDSLVNKGIPAPTDFLRIAPTLTAAGLSKHYDVGHRVISRWVKETGAKVGKAVRELEPAPTDFAEVAPTLYQYELCKRYNVGWTIIKRWLFETRATPKPYDARPPAPGGMVFRGHAKSQVHRDLRQHTMFDEAADILRRERFVVYRCGPTGVFLEKGLHWRVGNVVCTPDELLRRADKYRSKAA